LKSASRCGATRPSTPTRTACTRSSPDPRG
jgi:hypothetical protein